MGADDNRGRIRSRHSIDHRPAVVDRKNRLGDWEGDTIIGKERIGALLTRLTGTVSMWWWRKLSGKGAGALADELVRQYFPKGVDLTMVTEIDIQFVMYRLSNHANAIETLGWRKHQTRLMGAQSTCWLHDRLQLETKRYLLPTEKANKLLHAFRK